MGAVAFVSLTIHATPGNVLLVLAAGSRLSAYIGATVGEIGFLRGIWLDGSKRMAWLEDYAASRSEHCDAPVPERLTSGIRFERVSFAYPGTERLVLEDVCLELKPGSVVAIVGENGAGKTTLVKLLCRLYQPTSGRILVDGFELARMPSDVWRSRLAGAFQDFFRFEFIARHSVGVGDVPRLDDEPAVVAAVDRAGALDVVERLAAGLETQLGPTWPGGVEVSFGQWQKLALARGFMRGQPLLLMLDEPTAALDAETEHASLRALRGGSPRREVERRGRAGRRPHHHPGFTSIQHRAGWPISSSCSTDRAWSRWERTMNSWRKAGSTRNFTGFKRRGIDRGIDAQIGCAIRRRRQGRRRETANATAAKPHIATVVGSGTGADEGLTPELQAGFLRYSRSASPGPGSSA